MKRNIEKYLVLILAMTAVFAFSAYCCQSNSFGHLGGGQYTGIDNTSNDYDAAFMEWDMDGSGSVAAETGSYDPSIYKDSSGWQWLSGNWGDYTAGSGVSGCPEDDSEKEPMSAALCWAHSEGSTNHYGQYCVMGVDYDGSLYDFAPTDSETYAVGRMPYVTNIYNIQRDTPSAGDTQATITWTQASANYARTNELSGDTYNFTSDSQLVLGYEIYYKDSTSIPTSGDITGAGWTEVDAYASGDADANGIIDGVTTTTADVQVFSQTNDIYFAVGIVFADGSGGTGQRLGLVGENSFNHTNANNAGARIAPAAATVTSFDATLEDGTVDLTWETSSESNFAGFNVYRSTDNKNFTKINKGMIRAKGPSTYNFTDEVGSAISKRKSKRRTSRRTAETDKKRTRRSSTVETDSQQIYYRLEKIDLDGTTEFVGSTFAKDKSDKKRDLR